MNVLGGEMFLRDKVSVSFTSVIGTNAYGQSVKCARPPHTTALLQLAVYAHTTDPLRTLAIVLFTSSKYARIMVGGIKENEIGYTHFPCVIVRIRRLYWSSYGNVSRVWRLLLHNYVRHTCQMSETREIRSS